MKTRNLFYLLLAISLLLAACAPSARDVAEEVIAIQAEATQTALASEPHCTNDDGGTYTVGEHEWFMGKEYVCTEDGLGNASFLPAQAAATNTPFIPQTATPFPTVTQKPVQIAKYCIGAGGKWLVKYNDGIQFAGYLDRAKLMSTGLPLQPYLYQVNVSGITEITWNGVQMKLDPTEEPFNDGGATQLIACQDETGVWHYYQATRVDNFFNLTSYITWENGLPLGREHDGGAAGTWTGTPGGRKIVFTEVTLETVSPELITHWDAVQALIARIDSVVCEPGCIASIWHKP